MKSNHLRDSVVTQAHAAGHTSLFLGNALFAFGGILMVVAVLSATPLLTSLAAVIVSGLVGIALIVLGLYIKSMGRLLESLAEMLQYEVGRQTEDLAPLATKRGVPDADSIARAVNEVTSLELDEK